MALVACNPVFNWREVRLPQAGLKAWLPCKPDQGSRSLALADAPVTVQMVGCEAGGALYAVSQAEVGEAALAPAQSHWQRALLANLQAVNPTVQPWSIAGGAAVGVSSALTSRQLQVTGRRSDGHAMQVQAVWFARGPWLFHAAVYAERISPEMAEPFFSGLALP